MVSKNSSGATNLSNKRQINASEYLQIIKEFDKPLTPFGMLNPNSYFILYCHSRLSMVCLAVVNARC